MEDWWETIIQEFTRDEDHAAEAAYLMGLGVSEWESTLDLIR
jgi:hypothetical protein